MRKTLWSFCFTLFAVAASAQSFEIGTLQDVYKGFIGETLKVPVRFTNNSDKTMVLLIKRVNASLGGTQKNYFCPDLTCLDQNVDDILVRIEPGQTLTNLQVALETGLAIGISSVKYLVFNKSNLMESLEFDLNFAVEERSAKADIYTSPHITLHDVYPNPVTDYAFVEYAIINEAMEAKIIIHNILGNPIEEYDLPSSENKIKIRSESMNAGIYFFTLYLDNEGVMTRKLIVKK